MCAGAGERDPQSVGRGAADGVQAPREKAAACAVVSAGAAVSSPSHHGYLAHDFRPYVELSNNGVFESMTTVVVLCAFRESHV